MPSLFGGDDRTDSLDRLSDNAADVLVAAGVPVPESLTQPTPVRVVVPPGVIAGGYANAAAAQTIPMLAKPPLPKWLWWAVGAVVVALLILRK